MRHLLLALLLILAACGEDESSGNNVTTTANSDSPVCDGDEAGSSRASCEAEGCTWFGGVALDPETCLVASQTNGSCGSPEQDLIPGPVLVISGDTVYRYDDGAPLGSRVCSETTANPACACPLN